MLRNRIAAALLASASVTVTVPVVGSGAVINAPAANQDARVVSTACRPAVSPSGIPIGHIISNSVKCTTARLIAIAVAQSYMRKVVDPFSARGFTCTRTWIGDGSQRWLCRGGRSSFNFSLSMATE